MSKQPKPNPKLDPINQDDLKSFQNIINSRRSVRRFESTAIPENVVENCLDMAMLAPNSSNLQPWEFYVIKSPKVKKSMDKICLNQNAATTAPLLIAIVARTKTWKDNAKDILKYWPEPKIPSIVEKYYGRQVLFSYGLGPFGVFGMVKKAMVSVIGLTRPIPRGPFSKAEMRLWSSKTCSLAAENLMLAFKAHGYDTCPMEGFDGKRAKKLLNLAKDSDVVMIIAAGKASEKGVYNNRFRFDKERFVFEK